MKTIAVLFAGAMLTSAVLSAMNDPGAQERFRMKYGRYAPAEEARPAGHCSQMHHEMKVDTAPAVSRNDAQNRFLAKFGRLPEVDRSAPPVGLAADRPARMAIARYDSGNDERFRMKYGRSIPVQDLRPAEPLLVASAAMTCDHECCRHPQSF
jgi:hypothetical protein